MAEWIVPAELHAAIVSAAFRKRGFHIGAARVQSSDVEESTTKELDLVSMANALLRMGDAALIINEEVKASGKIPSASQIAAWISDAAPKE